MYQLVNFTSPTDLTLARLWSFQHSRNGAVPSRIQSLVILSLLDGQTGISDRCAWSFLHVFQSLSGCLFFR